MKINEIKLRLESVSGDLDEFMQSISTKLTEEEYNELSDIVDEIDDILIDSANEKYFSNFINESFVYIMKDSNLPNMVKIGKSNNINNRERTLQGEKPTITIYKYIKFNGEKAAFEFETVLHKRYKNNRIRGEWFELNEKELQILINEYEWKDCII